jgi:hypothetical protein
LPISSNTITGERVNLDDTVTDIVRPQDQRGTERTLTFSLSQDYNGTSMKYLSLILTLTLAACGVPEMVKPGTSQQESAKERFECLRTSESTSSWSLFGVGSSQVRYDPDIYRSCMEARGYVIGKN